MYVHICSKILKYNPIALCNVTYTFVFMADHLIFYIQDFIKLKGFWVDKEIINQVERPPTEWEQLYIWRILISLYEKAGQVSHESGRGETHAAPTDWHLKISRRWAYVCSGGHCHTLGDTSWISGKPSWEVLLQFLLWDPWCSAQVMSPHSPQWTERLLHWLSTVMTVGPGPLRHSCHWVLLVSLPLGAGSIHPCLGPITHHWPYFLLTIFSLILLISAFYACTAEWANIYWSPGVWPRFCLPPSLPTSPPASLHPLST